jgi:hypothetical protein
MQLFRLGHSIELVEVCDQACLQDGHAGAEDTSSLLPEDRNNLPLDIQGSRARANHARHIRKPLWHRNHPVDHPSKRLLTTDANCSAHVINTALTALVCAWPIKSSRRWMPIHPA